MGTFSEIINSEKPTLVDFYATWCGPCQNMMPILDDLKKRLGNEVTVLKIDVDKSPKAASAYGIKSMPTLLLFKNGKIEWRQSGVVPAKVLEEIIQKHSK